MRKSRKNEIFETAMELFRQNGYDNVSVLDICNACGITKKAFYYHYASKDELAVQYFRATGEAFDWDALKAQEQQPNTNYLELLWQYEGYIVDCGINLGTDLHDTARLYDTHTQLNLYSPFPDGPYKNWTDQSEYIAMVSRGQAAGQIRNDYPAQKLLFFLFSAVIGLSAHWRSAGRTYDLKSEVRQIFDFVFMKP